MYTRGGSGRAGGSPIAKTVRWTVLLLGTAGLVGGIGWSAVSVARGSTEIPPRADFFVPAGGGEGRCLSVPARRLAERESCLHRLRQELLEGRIGLDEAVDRLETCAGAHPELRPHLDSYAVLRLERSRARVAFGHLPGPREAARNRALAERLGEAPAPPSPAAVARLRLAGITPTSLADAGSRAALLRAASGPLSRDFREVFGPRTADGLERLLSADVSEPRRAVVVGDGVFVPAAAAAPPAPEPAADSPPVALARDVSGYTDEVIDGFDALEGARLRYLASAGELYRLTGSIGSFVGSLRTGEPDERVRAAGERAAADRAAMLARLADLEVGLGLDPALLAVAREGVGTTLELSRACESSALRRRAWVRTGAGVVTGLTGAAVIVVGAGAAGTVAGGTTIAAALHAAGGAYLAYRSESPGGSEAGRAVRRTTGAPGEEETREFRREERPGDPAEGRAGDGSGVREELDEEGLREELGDGAGEGEELDEEDDSTAPEPRRSSVPALLPSPLPEEALELPPMLGPDAHRDLQRVSLAEAQERIDEFLRLDVGRNAAPATRPEAGAAATTSELIAEAQEALRLWVERRELSPGFGEFFLRAELENLPAGRRGEALHLASERYARDRSVYRRSTGVEDLRARIAQRLVVHCRAGGARGDLILQACSDPTALALVVVAAVHDAGLALPDGAVLGVQARGAHFDPVLYDADRHEVVSLSSGARTSGVSAPLYHPASFYYSFLVERGARPEIDPDEHLLIARPDPGVAVLAADCAEPKRRWPKVIDWLGSLIGVGARPLPGPGCGPEAGVPARTAGEARSGVRVSIRKPALPRPSIRGGRDGGGGSGGSGGGGSDGSAVGSRGGSTSGGGGGGGGGGDGSPKSGSAPKAERPGGSPDGGGSAKGAGGEGSRGPSAGSQGGGDGASGTNGGAGGDGESTDRGAAEADRAGGRTSGGEEPAARADSAKGAEGKGEGRGSGTGDPVGGGASGGSTGGSEAGSAGGREGGAGGTGSAVAGGRASGEGGDGGAAAHAGARAASGEAVDLGRVARESAALGAAAARNGVLRLRPWRLREDFTFDPSAGGVYYADSETALSRFRPDDRFITMSPSLMEERRRMLEADSFPVYPTGTECSAGGLPPRRVFRRATGVGTAFRYVYCNQAESMVVFRARDDALRYARLAPADRPLFLSRLASERIRRFEQSEEVAKIHAILHDPDVLRSLPPAELDSLVTTAGDLLWLQETLEAALFLSMREVDGSAIRGHYYDLHRQVAQSPFVLEFLVAVHRFNQRLASDPLRTLAWANSLPPEHRQRFFRLYFTLGGAMHWPRRWEALHRRYGEGLPPSPAAAEKPDQPSLDFLQVMSDPTRVLVDWSAERPASRASIHDRRAQRGKERTPEEKKRATEVEERERQDVVERRRGGTRGLGRAGRGEGLGPEHGRRPLQMILVRVKPERGDPDGTRLPEDNPTRPGGTVGKRKVQEESATRQEPVLWVPPETFVDAVLSAWEPPRQAPAEAGRVPPAVRLSPRLRELFLREPDKDNFYETRVSFAVSVLGSGWLRYAEVRDAMGGAWSGVRAYDTGRYAAEVSRNVAIVDQDQVRGPSYFTRTSVDIPADLYDRVRHGFSRYGTGSFDLRRLEANDPVRLPPPDPASPEEVSSRADLLRSLELIAEQARSRE